MSEYLLTREVAELLRAPEATARYWRHIGTGPLGAKVGRRVLYRREAVIAWLLAQEEVGNPEAHQGLAASLSRSGGRRRGSRRRELDGLSTAG